MYKYALTEAYSEIYNPRKIEESFDNLRFVDYMLPEHIEEVIEELVWEFRDYGNTLEESFEMIDYALEDEVICESYDQLVADVLYEATITKGKDRSKFAGSAQGRVTTGKTYRFDPQEVQRRAKRLGQVKSASQSVMSRMSNLSGPISSVRQGISGSKGGLGKANKSLGGDVVKRGQALLKGLLRRGGEALSKTGKRMMASGTSASKSGLASRQAGKATRSGQMALNFEPSTKEKAGSAATSVGRAIRRIGVALQRKAGTEPSKMTRGDYEQRKAERSAAAKSAVGDAFAAPKEPASRLKPNVPGRKERVSSGGIKSPDVTVSSQKQGSSQLRLLPSADRPPITTQKVSGGFDPTKKSSQNKRPKGKQTTAKGVHYSELTPKQATQYGSQQPVARERAKLPRSQRVAPGTTGERGVKKSKDPEYVTKTVRLSRPPEPGQATGPRTIRTRVRIREDHLNEILQFISEDLIEAGYTSNLNESYDLIDQMDESTLYDIIQEYLD